MFWGYLASQPNYKCRYEKDVKESKYLDVIGMHMT